MEVHAVYVQVRDELDILIQKSVNTEAGKRAHCLQGRKKINGVELQKRINGYVLAEITGRGKHVV